jgi:hypothetical protein
VSAARPLRNRVDPFGELHAVAARGALMGNRGGRFHRDDQTLRTRRWASRQWIACICKFKGRRRDVWGWYYTELFFLDEPTALAAGHRPCFECRRADAVRFRDALGEGRLSADEMDARLHAERLDGRSKRLHRMDIAGLPDGAFIVLEGRAHAVRGDALLPWSFDGYGPPLPRPRSGHFDALTPPTILRALAAGYASRENLSFGPNKK